MKRIILFLVITLVLSSGCVTYQSFRNIHGEYKDLQYEDFPIVIAIVSASNNRKGLNYYRVGIWVKGSSFTDIIKDSLIIDSVCIQQLAGDYRICPIDIHDEPYVIGVHSRNVFLPEKTDSIAVSFDVAIYNLDTKKIIKRDRIIEKLYRKKERHVEIIN